MQRESRFSFPKLQIVILQTTDFHFANYRVPFHKLQISISQTTDIHFANYRFPFCKLQIFTSQTTDFHFVSFHFVSKTTVSQGWPSIGRHTGRYINQQLTEMLADTSIDSPPKDTRSNLILDCNIHITVTINPSNVHTVCTCSSPITGGVWCLSKRNQRFYKGNICTLLGLLKSF